MRMKLSDKERQFILGRRRFLKILTNSRKLTAGRKKAKKSEGERRIAKFFFENHIEYQREWYFKGLYNYAKSTLLYFDFYIPRYNLCIEFDGKQHYNQNKTEAEKMNDYLKNAYCLKNDINFLRIKYTDYENIERLILEKIDKIEPITNTRVNDSKRN